MSASDLAHDDSDDDDDDDNDDDDDDDDDNDVDDNDSGIHECEVGRDREGIWEEMDKGRGEERH